MVTRQKKQSWLDFLHVSGVFSQTKSESKYTMTKVLHTGAVKCPDPGRRFAIAQMAFANPWVDARSIVFPSKRTSKGIASLPSWAHDRGKSLDGD